MMNGMLWFDNDPKTTMAAKIMKAVAFYTKKYGRNAEVCLVNEKDAQGVDLADISKSSTVLVKAIRGVSPSHLWIGFEEALPTAGGER